MRTDAIIYARVSSVGDRQSTERQVSDLKRFAEYSNLNVVKIFEEKISGAKKNQERPVLLEAIGFAREHDAVSLQTELGLFQILCLETTHYMKIVYFIKSMGIFSVCIEVIVILLVIVFVYIGAVTVNIRITVYIVIVSHLPVPVSVSRLDMVVEVDMRNPVLNGLDGQPYLMIRVVCLSLVNTTFCQSQSG